MSKFKSFVIVLGVLLLASVTSCTKDKDGVYSPKKKIQRIYQETPYANRYLAQMWNWNGKKLESINYYSTNGTPSWTANFTYEDNRLSRVDNYIDSEYVSYSYDGNKLKQANYYYKSNLSYTMDFTYNDDNKMSKMVYSEFGDKSKSENRLNPLEWMFSKEIANKIERCFQNQLSQTKEIWTATVTFIWDNDNISKMTYTGDDGEMGFATFQYDTKNNPIKGFLQLYPETYLEEAELFWSKNNVTKIIVTENNSSNYVDNIIYQYDSDDYPVMQIEGDDDKYITYFEYE